MIPGDHNCTNPGLGAGFHSRRNLRPRGINQAYKAGKDQPVFQMLQAALSASSALFKFTRIKAPPAYRQNTQRILCQIIIINQHFTFMYGFHGTIAAAQLVKGASV